MLKITIKHDLDRLITNVERYNKAWSDLDGKPIDVDTVDTFVSGPALHQKSENQTEEESATFEQKYPKLFAYFRNLHVKMNKLLRS